jgi:hypothetical protein
MQIEEGIRWVVWCCNIPGEEVEVLGEEVELD